MWQKLAESSEVCVLEAENHFPLQVSALDQLFEVSLSLLLLRRFVV